MEKIRVRAIEVNATMHCNLSCAGCSHASPVSTEWIADPDTVHRDLTRLYSAVEIQKVRVVGGEPLLHPDLPRLLRSIRDAGPIEILRLTTNGTRLHKGDLKWVRFVDEIFLSVYPGTVVRPVAVEALRREAAAQGVPLHINHYSGFRQVLPERRLNDAETRAVYDNCQVAHAWSAHTVQNGYVYKCPMTVPSGVAEDRASRCAIEPVDTLPIRLREFLGAKEPLPECSSCLGSVGQLRPHRQIRRAAWADASRSGIDWEQVERVRRDPRADNGVIALTTSS